MVWLKDDMPVCWYGYNDMLPVCRWDDYNLAVGMVIIMICYLSVGMAGYGYNLSVGMAETLKAKLSCISWSTLLLLLWLL